MGKGRKPKAADDAENSSSEGSAGAASSDDEENKEVAESWVEWIQRTTHEVIDIMGKVGMSDWVEEQSNRKWKWCGHTLRRQDGRWSLKLLLWIPDHGHRNRGHPITRWSDSIVSFMSDVLQE